MKEILIAYIIINIFSFIAYASDKLKAIKKEYRISEKALILWAFIGPFGAFLAMTLVRHKTKHIKFKLGVPFFMLVHAVLIGLYMGNIAGLDDILNFIE